MGLVELTEFLVKTLVTNIYYDNARSLVNILYVKN